MATLEKIRKRSVLLFGIIIVALLAFILGDFLNSGRSFFSDPSTACKVDGHKIDITELNNRISEAKQGNPNLDEGQLREQILQQMITESLFNEELDKLGIVVTDEELTAFIFPESDPAQKEQMQQLYELATNPGKYDIPAEQAAQYKNYWSELEKNAASQLKQIKYAQLLQSTLLPNKLDMAAQTDLLTQNIKVRLASKGTADLNDDDFAVSDKEIEAEYEKYKNSPSFKITEPVHAVDFIVVNVEPSADDRTAAQQEVNNAVAGLRANNATENIDGNYNFRTERLQLTAEQLNQARGQLQQQMMQAYQSGRQLPEGMGEYMQALAIADTIPVGSVWEAPLTSDTYTMLKMISHDEVKSDTDSVMTYNFAVIQYTIEPSQATRDNAKQALAEFVKKNDTAEKFAKNAEAAGYTIQHQGLTPSNFTLGGMPATFDEAHWALKADKGQVSSVMSNDRDDRFIAIAVSDVYEGDLIPASDTSVKNLMTQIVRNRKKTDKLVSDYAGKASSIDEYATLMNGAEAVPMEIVLQAGSPLGQAVLGRASVAKDGELVGPMAGTNQVVAFEVIESSNVETPVTPSQMRSQYSSRVGAGSVASRLDRILRHDKKIKTRIHDLMGSQE